MAAKGPSKGTGGHGRRKLAGKQLRLLNEVPGVAAAIIIILVILKPF